MIRFPQGERGRDKGRYLKPVGELQGNFEQLMEAGCIQAETPALEPMFLMLMPMTNNNPCDGCPVWERKGPECAAFQQYHTAYTNAVHDQHQALEAATKPSNFPPGHRFFGRTMKEVATELGVSLGEVRRRKAAGTL
jgi:hypothetical protein